MKRLNHKQIKRNIEDAHDQLIIINTIIDVHSTRKKWFDISMLVILSIGALLCFIWDYSPLISTFIVVLAHFTISIFQIILGTNDIAILNHLSAYYKNHICNLERLRNDLVRKTKNESDIAALFATYQYDILLIRSNLVEFLNNRIKNKWNHQPNFKKN